MPAHEVILLLTSTCALSTTVWFSAVHLRLDAGFSFRCAIRFDHAAFVLWQFVGCMPWLHAQSMCCYVKMDELVSPENQLWGDPVGKLGPVLTMSKDFTLP